MPKRLLICLIAVACFLTACSSTRQIGPYTIDASLEAKGQNTRVRHIVLHYTTLDTATSLRVLTEQNVSSHYVISDATPPVIYQLVKESQRAWHAGVSQWHDYPDLNTSSIGIEMVNAGRLSDGSWQPYSAQQIDALIRLLNDIRSRHPVADADIVGHSDIAPQRKVDPGPLFPWTQLAEAGLGRWYDPLHALEHQQQLSLEGLPSYSAIQSLLKKAGYATPLHGEWDKTSQNVLRAFQLHYRPSNYNGLPDIETISILQALTR